MYSKYNTVTTLVYFLIHQDQLTDPHYNIKQQKWTSLAQTWREELLQLYVTDRKALSETAAYWV